MKKFLSMIALTLALLVSPVSTVFAQNPDYRAGVRSAQSGNSVYFTAFNQTAETVCIWPTVAEATNVNGAVVPMIQLGAGESNVNIGAFAQANSQDAWSVRVTAQWRIGTCA
jgi:hypothetical protein